MAKRIYKVVVVTELIGEKPVNGTDEYRTHLVKAASTAQAERHVTKKIVTASIATTEECIVMTKDGVEVEEAGE